MWSHNTPHHSASIPPPAQVITFVPPDGEFELMRYRCQDMVSLPFKVLPSITEFGRTRVEVNVTVKANYSSKIIGQQV
eukprot:361451-Chlamydomonas_euryale.AAC.7